LSVVGGSGFFQKKYTFSKIQRSGKQKTTNNEQTDIISLN